jgi:hypothetical protein
MRLFFIQSETGPYRRAYALGFRSIFPQYGKYHPQIFIFIRQSAQVTDITVRQHRLLIVNLQYRPVISVLDKCTELTANHIIKSAYIGIVRQMVDMVLERTDIVEPPVDFIFQITPYAVTGM